MQNEEFCEKSLRLKQKRSGTPYRRTKEKGDRSRPKFSPMTTYQVSQANA